jgi:hypothetical protein
MSGDFDDLRTKIYDAAMEACAQDGMRVGSISVHQVDEAGSYALLYAAFDIIQCFAKSLRPLNNSELALLIRIAQGKVPHPGMGGGDA